MKVATAAPSPDDNNDRFIDKKELGRYLCMGKTAIERLMRDKRIPFMKFGNSRRATVRFYLKDVLKALGLLRGES